MRLMGTKSEPEGLVDKVGDSVAELSGGVTKERVVKTGLVAGGVVALTAASAAISSLRRRAERQ
ncbi:MAG TPA: hypothetical protein VHH55_05170, partial [Gaiellaceae bacterium]|nr:hypothetical protein [Gaiellaceae bacterium]